MTLLVRAKGMRVGGNAFAGAYRKIRIFVRGPDEDPAWRLHTWFNVRAQDLQP